MKHSVHIDCTCKPPKGINRTTGRGWATAYKERKRLRTLIWAELHRSGMAQIKLAPPVRIKYCRRYARLPMDPDNLAGSGKYVIDAVRKEGIIPDDDPTAVVEYRCTQEKVVTVKQEGFSITITEL